MQQNNFKNSTRPVKASEEAKAKPKKPHFHQKHPKISLLIVALLITLIAGIIYYCLNQNKTVAPHQKTQKPAYYSALSGRKVNSKDKVHATTTCIMIENSAAARPQSGLEDAGVIYEAIAEGGISRFLALYQDRKPELVGPIRSVRMHFAEWAMPYHCSLAHVGGADDALKSVRHQDSFRDIDQFFNDGTYWRSRNRRAPHNVYSSFEKIDALNRDKNYDSSIYNGFARRDQKKTAKTNPKSKHKKASKDASKDQPVKTNLANLIDINLGADKTFNVHYQWDRKNNNYIRSYQNGTMHQSINLNGQSVQLRPDVVIAMAVDSVGRPGTNFSNFTTTGSGTAHIFQNGKVIKATWHKDSVQSELVFRNKKSKIIKLNRGQTWISAYPKNVGSIHYSQRD